MDFFLEEEAECWAVPWDHSATGGLSAEVPHTLLGAVEPLTPCVPLLASGGQIFHPATAPRMEKPKNS